MNRGEAVQAYRVAAQMGRRLGVVSLYIERQLGRACLHDPQRRETATGDPVLRPQTGTEKAARESAIIPASAPTGHQHHVGQILPAVLGHTDCLCLLGCEYLSPITKPGRDRQVNVRCAKVRKRVGQIQLGRQPVRLVFHHLDGRPVEEIGRRGSAYPPACVWPFLLPAVFPGTHIAHVLLLGLRPKRRRHRGVGPFVRMQGSTNHRLFP